MTYHWKKGFHAPTGVSAEDMKSSLEKLSQPSPQELLEASKRKSHVLHSDLWDEGDQVWAARGRLERCRSIISSLVEEVEIAGGRTIEIRAVEHIVVNGDGYWATLNDIRSDEDMLDAYLAEVQKLQEQASAKMAKVRELISHRS